MIQQHPLEKIHHINPKFNRLFSMPLYYIGAATAMLLFILPYSLRLALAFLINIFFNRPIIYLNLFAQKIGKKINAAVIAIFYFTFFGLYALLYQLFHFLKRKWQKDSLWLDIKEVSSSNEYFHQS